MKPYFISANLSTSINTVNYEISVTDAGGCKSNTDNFSFTINHKPNIIGIGSSVVSQGVQISPTITGGSTFLTYQWLPTSGLNDPSLEQPVADPPSTTTYTLTVTDNKGCKSSANTTITVNKPIVTAMADISICEGAAVTLSASAIGGTLPYTWNIFGGPDGPKTFSGVTTMFYSFIPEETKTYIIQVIDANGNVSTDEVFIKVLPKPTVDLGPDITICAGKSIQLIPTIIGDKFQLATFNWIPNQTLSNNGLFVATVNPTDTTSYALNLVRKNGCTSTEYIVVYVNPVPNGHISYANGLLEAHSNAGTPPRTYEWTPSNATSATITPVSNVTNYSLKIIDAEGCTATASYTLQLPIAIRGKVFWDFIKNGLRDGVETAVPDLWVNLLKPDNSVQSRIKTDLLGKYVFLNVPHGQYRISFDLSDYTGVVFSLKDEGNNDAIDSDANVDGKTDLIWVGSSTFDMTNIDAGLVDIEPPTISNVPMSVTVNSSVAWAAATSIINPTFTDNLGLVFPISNGTGAGITYGNNCLGNYYKMIWTPKDKFNNISLPASYSVYLKDIAPPIISLTPNNITVSCLGLDAQKNIVGITATDLVDNSVIPIVSFLTISSTIIRQVWTAKDACGNSSIKDRYITTTTACTPNSTIQSKSSANVNSSHPIHVVAMPNPTTSMVKIELSLKEKNTAAFELYDFSGRLIWWDQTSLEDTYFLEEVDLSSLPKGIYLLRANSGTHTITERIIKQ